MGRPGLPRAGPSGRYGFPGRFGAFRGRRLGGTFWLQCFKFRSGGELCGIARESAPGTGRERTPDAVHRPRLVAERLQKVLHVTRRGRRQRRLDLVPAACVPVDDDFRPPRVRPSVPGLFWRPRWRGARTRGPVAFFTAVVQERHRRRHVLGTQDRWQALGKADEFFRLLAIRQIIAVCNRLAGW